MKHRMGQMTEMALGILVGGLVLAGSAGAQGISIIQGNDGTSGTVFDLGGGIKTYSDSRGTTGTIQDLGGGIQTFNFHSSQGQSQSGTILSFPSTSSSQSGSSLNFSGTSRGNQITPVPLGPGSPLPPLVPLTPHTVITPGFAPTSSHGTFGHR